MGMIHKEMLSMQLLWAYHFENPQPRSRHFRGGITLWHLKTGKLELHSPSFSTHHQAPCWLLFGSGWRSHRFTHPCQLTSIAVRIRKNNGPLFALPPLTQLQQSGNLARLTDRIIQLRQTPVSEDPSLQALEHMNLQSVLWEWCHDLTAILHAHHLNPFAPVIKHPGLREAVSWLNKQTGKILEPQVAEIACMSVSHLKRVFKQEMNMSLREYLHQHRLELCTESLTRTTKSIKEVSFNLGFNNPASFTHWFKKHFHQTPKQYRQSHPFII